jgi:hypothetical protein
MDESQRSMVAAKIARLPLGANQHGTASDEGVSIDTPSLGDAAELMNVGRATAARARKVQENAAPELVEAVEKVVRLQAKVAKDDVSARQARILAEGEAALARRFAEDDEAFADLTTDARAYMDGIKEKIDARAAELGIPATFRPTMSAYWFSRGENADPKRRVELRRVLQAQAEATAKAAKLEIDRWSADLQAGIIAGGLASEARELLDRLPTAEALMPPLRLPELGR